MSSNCILLAPLRLWSVTAHLCLAKYALMTNVRRPVRDQLNLAAPVAAIRSATCQPGLDMAVSGGFVSELAVTVATQPHNNPHGFAGRHTKKLVQRDCTQTIQQDDGRLQRAGQLGGI